MSERPDPESESQQPSSELGKVYTWQGRTLEPFSAGRQTALQRLEVIRGSVIEAASALVLLCFTPALEVVKIRGDACTQFLVDLVAWQEREGIGMGTLRAEKTKQLIALYDSILNDIYEAEKLSPDTSGAPSSGNA